MTVFEIVLSFWLLFRGLKPSVPAQPNLANRQKL
jgi:hypothetical protein